MNELEGRPRLERLSAADIEDNVALSASVGWKDVASEWRVLHAAAHVLGARQQGRLVAHAALGDHGSAATLAKMVVRPEFQGRGLGGRLLDDLLALAARRHSPVGLCATPQGQPLYQSRGFVAVGEIVIMTGAPTTRMTPGRFVVPLLQAEVAAELDRRFTACDRSRMLSGRFREAQAAWQIEAAGEQGFGLATTHGETTVVGPLLAASEDSARAIAQALLGAAAGQARIDVPVEQVSFRRWLGTLGLREQAQRLEMALGADRLPWQVPERFALATQAWG